MEEIELLIESNKRIRLSVQMGKRVVHPDCRDKKEGDILDPAIPLDMQLVCNQSSISLLPLAEKIENTRWVRRTVSIKKRNRGEFSIIPSPRGIEINWAENWLELICINKAHAQYVMERLETALELGPFFDKVRPLQIRR